MATNLGHSIRTAYFYVFSAIGIILLIIGVFKLSDYGVRKVFLDNYYLPYEAGRCSYPQPQDKCLEELSRERKVKEVTDISSSITFLVVGSALFAFHYRRARKLS